MAEPCPDGVDIDAGTEEVCGSGVSDRVWAAARRVPLISEKPRDAHNVVEPPANTATARRPPRLRADIAGTALLGTGNGNEFFFPVHVLDAQAGNFPAAECVNCKQHQDGAISNVARLVSIGAGDQTLHISPTGTYRKSFLLEDSWTFDSGCHARSAPAADFGIPKERP